MSLILKGKPVADALTENAGKIIEVLKQHDITPTLAVVRVGAREDDLAYERGITARFSRSGAKVEIHEFNIDVGQDELAQAVKKLNDDKNVHGILVFRPLPKSISEEKINELISPQKDVDCSCKINKAYVFSDDKRGFAPCTAQAVMEIIKHYDIDLSGKRVSVVGRSMVIGKPLAMMLLCANATVTVCHSRTADLREECKRADIIVACLGKAKFIDESFLSPGQIVIDVGINEDDDGICGDVDFEQAEKIVSAVTPVPGGVGSVTTSVLLNNTVKAAEKLI